VFWVVPKVERGKNPVGLQIAFLWSRRLLTKYIFGGIVSPSATSHQGGLKKMTILTPEPTEKISELLKEVLSSARYLVNAQGGKTDVVLSLEAWQKILAWLEEVDDRAVVQEWLPRLQAGPESSNALRWDDIAAEWEEDDPPI
jgi:hypothetical protein